MFFPSICLDATKFVLLSVFTYFTDNLPETGTKSLPKNAKRPLAVNARGLKRPYLSSL